MAELISPRAGCWQGANSVGHFAKIAVKLGNGNHEKIKE
jgi:hypothetical protein